LLRGRCEQQQNTHQGDVSHPGLLAWWCGHPISVYSLGKRKFAFEPLGRPTQFFEKVCELDLEGIVAKRMQSQYRPAEKPSPYWVKIKNPKYSQAEGREELFSPKPDAAEALNLAK
jgi:hypothetical protein